jgi:5-methylthioadenosine/S-adenosylhomocysteine deaminase
VAAATSSPPDPYLLENGIVVSSADAGADRLSAAVASVAVEHGVIAAVGARAELRRRFPALRRIDCAQRIVMPGLVNAHLHPELHLLKGALEQRGLHDWHSAAFYNAAVELLGSAEGRALQQTAALASVAEAALSGTTCIGTYGVSAGSTETCAAALDHVGLRGTVTIRDSTFVPATAARPAFYRLHAEETLFEPELTAAAAAHARGARIVMHAAETAQRIEMIRRRYGTTTIRLLAQRGLLSPRVLLSHAIQVDADEIGMIARHGAHVVVSPSAEMKLGDGIPPVVDMLRAGVNVALGTDAAVCNNSTDMFLEMRALGLSQKLRYGAAALTPDRILLIATRGGAAALGAGAPAGSLAPGAVADIVMLDTRLQPLVAGGARSNLTANIVFAATGADVTDVLVDGRFIVRRRRLLTLDARALWRELDAAARRLHDRIRD